MNKYIIWQPIASNRVYVCFDTIDSDKSIEALEDEYNEMGIYFPKITLYSDDNPIYNLDIEYHNFLLEHEQY